MVDRPKRTAAAKAIEDFLSCRITNFEYSHRYPRSDDPVLFAIHSILWSGCSEEVEHRLNGKNSLSGERRQVVERCILFLESEFEYHGTREFQILSAPLKRIWHKLRGRAVPKLISPVWPFDSPEQLEAARHKAKRL
jgi:hypothetical protein